MTPRKVAKNLIVKLTPVVNFINIKRANFLYEFIYIAKTKLEKGRSYEKFVRKMLMKLTPGFPIGLVLA